MFFINISLLHRCAADPRTIDDAGVRCLAYNSTDLQHDCEGWMDCICDHECQRAIMTDWKYDIQHVSYENRDLKPVSHRECKSLIWQYMDMEAQQRRESGQGELKSWGDAQNVGSEKEEYLPGAQELMETALDVRQTMLLR